MVRRLDHPRWDDSSSSCSGAHFGDATRFQDQAVASYVGLIPSEFSSGGRGQRLGELTKQGRRVLCRFGIVCADATEPNQQRQYSRGRLMRIMRATLVNKQTSDGMMRDDVPLGTEYLVYPDRIS